MANYDIRTPIDYSFGQLSAGVVALDTTLSSTLFPALPSDLSTTKYVPVTLADDSRGAYEIVWVTGHSAASQSVTVVRGREGSSSQAWPAGSTWRIAPTARDVVSVVATRGALPTDAHLGMRVQIVSEARIVEKVAAGWQAVDPPFGHMGATAGFQATPGIVAMAAAQELLGGMTFNNSADALVIPLAGRYQLNGNHYATAGTLYAFTGAVTCNDTSTIPASYGYGRATFWKQEVHDYVATSLVTRRLVAGDLIRMNYDSAGSTFGSDGYNGAFVEVTYLGP